AIFSAYKNLLSQKLLKFYMVLMTKVGVNGYHYPWGEQLLTVALSFAYPRHDRMERILPIHENPYCLMVYHQALCADWAENLYYLIP
ncbi:hypothetical protein, partial [Legionella norrlandica]|uniref:hypothetical protein n=1 Tax=Legionella norrlandica TaxID=1498499 RepID=UPI0019D3D7B0